MQEVKNHENTNDDSTNSTQPHEAIFLVLAYLPVFELIAMSQVCKSIRDAVDNDILPWLKIMVVDKPLSTRLSDDYLMKITSKAKGRLISLALLNCPRITDDGLMYVVAGNPQLEKLFVPGCTRLTPAGVIKAVKMITKLRSLKINGIYNVTKDDLQSLHQLIGETSPTVQTKPFNLYHHRHSTISSDFEHDGQISPSIDVDICVRCQEVRMVFDCPRESCMIKMEQSIPSPSLEILRCRACYYCIPRCQECGVCIEDDEVGETACTDTLCLGCWLTLPKCDYCNKAYCGNHADQKTEFPTSSDGFICAICSEEHPDDYASQVGSTIVDVELN